MTITIMKDGSNFIMKSKDRRFEELTGHKSGLKAPLIRLFAYMDVVTNEVNNGLKEECLFDVEG